MLRDNGVTAAVPPVRAAGPSSLEPAGGTLGLGSQEMPLGLRLNRQQSGDNAGTCTQGAFAWVFSESSGPGFGCPGLSPFPGHFLPAKSTFFRSTFFQQRGFSEQQLWHQRLLHVPLRRWLLWSC